AWPPVLSPAEHKTEALLAGTAAIDEPFARKLRLVAGVNRRSAYDGYLTTSDDMATAIRQKIIEISPTDLEHYGECPQRFLIRKLLGVRELEDPEHEVQIDRRKKGGLDHRILERFYSQLRKEEIESGFFGRKLSPPLAARLKRAIDEEFEKHNIESPPVNTVMREIEEGYTLSLLEEFVATDLADLARTGFVPQEFEYGFGLTPESPPFTFSSGGVTIKLRGQIDRIDARGNPVEKLRIIDYKSGKALKQQGLADNIDEGHSFQLALYAIAYGTLASLPDSAIQGVIKPIRIQGLKEEDYSFELAEKRPLLDAALDLFLGAIVRGEFPAIPAKYCEYCAVAASCRTRHDVEEKQRLEEFGNAMTLLKTFQVPGSKFQGEEPGTWNVEPGTQR
ncbi:MAG TPA: PD-(D/E)XK nuclease family protein, partial [Thermoanaerobaculia bacterium]